MHNAVILQGEKCSSSQELFLLLLLLLLFIPEMNKSFCIFARVDAEE